MKIFAAALHLLILAAALGPPTHGLPAHDFSSADPWSEMILFHIQGGGVHRPGDCCFSYTPQNIRCAFMEDYYETGSGCSLPAVIFTNKWGHKFCANPQNERVQECMTKLASANTEKTVD